jgi:hypothetical protein
VKTLKYSDIREVAPAQTDVPVTADGLQAFKAESHNLTPPSPSPSRWRKSLILVAITLAFGASGLWAYMTVAATPARASLSIQTTPPGAQVSIDGNVIGSTPAAMTLPPGTYSVLLTADNGQQRQVEVTLRSGESVVHQSEWAAPSLPAALPTTGALHIQTEPAGQTVFVDDTRRGVSPLTVSDLTPGDHLVVVTGGTGTLRRPVQITAGETLSLVIAPNAPTVSAGWLQISSPVLLQMHVAGNLVGDTENDRVMLPAGEHQVEISNPALGFSVTRRVSVAAGRTTQVQITPPNGRVSINALPWAEVWLNGTRIGQTPLANFSHPIGTHDVVLRHPQLGERRATVTVSLAETARLGIDMRQP